MKSIEDLRVAIIGAGPSGLTLAYYLKVLGLKSVKFFEALDDVGGQSVTPDVDGIPVEMGTVYLTDGYVLAKRIAADVDCPAKVLPPATVLDAAGREDKHETPSFFLLARYVFLWLRWYFSGQMRAPDHPENALTFEEWLRRHGLGKLADGFVFTAGLTAQLYGPVGAISAHNGLNWMRPSLLITGRLSHTGHIPAGFQNMWRKLREHLGYDVRYDARIDEVQPTRAGDGYQVLLLYRGELVDGPFDHVFLACPLDHLENHPLEHLEGSPLERIAHPLSEELRTRFSPFAATEVYSAAWKAASGSWPEFAPSRCYLPAASTNERGPLLTIRNYATDGRAIGQLCSYAFLDEPPEDPQKRLEHNQKRLERNRDRVVADMQHIVKLKDIEIVQDRLWRYNIRFSRQQLSEGLPAFINAAQGKEHVWYTGATLSHWDIDAITDNSLVLAKRFAKQIGLPFFTRFRLYRVADLFADF